MNKKLVIIVSILHCVIMYGMEQSEKIYDCEKLKKQYPGLQGSKKEVNEALEQFLYDELPKDPLQFCDEPRNKNRDEHNAEVLACLICSGANPNKIVRKNFCNAFTITSRSRITSDLKTVVGYTPEYICPLQYAVSIDNAGLVSFLLAHKAHADISRIMRCARLKSYIDKYIVWPIKNCLDNEHNFLVLRSYNKVPLFAKIRSVEVAQKLAPHVNINKEISRGGEVACTMMSSNFDNMDLFKYFLEKADNLANTPIHKGKIPLHILAENCVLYSGKEQLLHQKASLLLEKTNDINTLDDKEETPFKKVLFRQDWNCASCTELKELFESHGGKATLKNITPRQELKRIKE